MKGLVQSVPALALVLSLAGGCASTSTPPAMPAWTPDSTEAQPASAPRDIDDDQMRIPSDEVLPEIWPASGLYLGGGLVTSQPLGDWNGELAYLGPTDIVVVPDLDLGAGAALYLGYRWRMNELLIQYSITEHDGDFPGSPEEHDTTITNIDLNWRHYFLEKSPLQPYGLLGLGSSRAKTDNGSTDQLTQTMFEDSEQKDGINVNVGVGAALYTLPWVVFYGEGMYRFSRYKTSNGIDGDFDNVPDVDGDSWNLSFGAALRILPPRK